MSLGRYYDEFVACLLRADRPGALALMRSAVGEGAQAGVLLSDVVQPAMEEVGVRWSRQQASLTQYFVAGRIGDDLTDYLVPLLEHEGNHTAGGRVVIGTIAGDYHGLGRKIVAGFLRVAGIDTRDLGLGVTPARFVDEAVAAQADIIAVSALMVHTLTQIKDLRPIADARGIGHVRIMVGGAPFNYHADLYRQVGADATARTAAEAVPIARELVAKGGIT